MSIHLRNSVLKGFIAGAVCWAGLIPVVFLVFGAASKKGTASALASIAPVFLFIGGLCILAGTVLGYMGGVVQVRRRLKMALGGLAVYWFDALLVSLWITLFSGEKPPPDYTIWHQLGVAFMLSLVGSLLYGIVLIPIVIIASLFVERWTRRTA